MKSLIATSVDRRHHVCRRVAGFRLVRRANGTTGASGWGSSSESCGGPAAALAECAVRTPRGYMCYVSFCR
jgi:hypothetical protein